MSAQFRLLDFNILNEDSTFVDDVEDDIDDDVSSEEEGRKPKRIDNKCFTIQMFGIDEKGRTYSVFVNDYKPFFFIRIPDSWEKSKLDEFKKFIIEHVGDYYAKSITKFHVIKRHKLYGFDNNKLYNFVKITFRNTIVMNKVKRLFYNTRVMYKFMKGEDEYEKSVLCTSVKYNGDIIELKLVKPLGASKKRSLVIHADMLVEREPVLKSSGLEYEGHQLTLYESNIPPLLRFFHIRDVSPSGWIQIPRRGATVERVNGLLKRTTCKYEFNISKKNIKSLRDKETNVPYKICSFDIEASSSHGDFPVPVKSYAKLTTNILDYWDTEREYLDTLTREQKEKYIGLLIKAAFRMKPSSSGGAAADYEEGDFAEHFNYYADEVFPKKNQTPKNEHVVDSMITEFLTQSVKTVNETGKSSLLESMFTMEQDVENASDEDETIRVNKKSAKKLKDADTIEDETTVVDLLDFKKFDREEKKNIMNELFVTSGFPELEGDKVTFIGSTFMKFGDDEPYMNHCIALDTCDDVDDAEIESYKTEKDVLLAWTRLIQKENPDIIIGYNIFGFDYSFMFHRAQENGVECVKEFLKLSRNKGEICGSYNSATRKYTIEQNKIVIASGTHKLEYVKTPGRVQVDLYNYFRREYNLTSYKLDYVSGHFIGDKIKNISYDEFVDDEDGTELVYTLIKSKNLTGLKDGNYIHIEEIGHSSEYYKNGAKFEVYDVNEEEGTFYVCDRITPDQTKTLKWCLAKDDVSPQDIFRMTNEGPTERAVIAKYCIQDCNLVHHLMNKIDVITGFVEMANICSIPIDFLVRRGQGIKLFSFIAQKCREAKTLIPVLQKKNDGGYEGAIVLDPKCGLYLDEPVACVDYSSLYPSSMISENLSHDSKVWTKEYDLDGNLIGTTGVRDGSKNFVYDNLPGYEYVDVKYDTYEYLRKTPKSAAVKTKVGSKICRFAQFPDGDLAIMPRILKELLAARKATRASAKWKTIKTSIGDYTGLVINKTDENVTVKDKDGNINVIERDSIISMEDTFNDFMKNVLDKRQLAIKVTANSLYGQCGARTSSFYEKDVAASTTATGRKLLTYGKRIIEEVYGDRICTTKYGTVHSHAEYVYGDTDSVFMSFKLTDPETGNKIVGKEALKHTIELAKEAGELATKFLKAPHDLEYEKTFMPFCLLSKKRYVGMLYEEDIEKCYRKSMGIVLKRRDNAPIVKDVYGGIIDILMKDQDVNKAIHFTKKCMKNIVEEKYPLEKLIITKSLRGFYKNPMQIAHKVLADRMGKRDPGNKPSAGDRIPFVYIQTKKERGKRVLQGDKIEHPEYIVKNKIKPDYGFYITNQIMKPVQQVFALVLEDIPAFKKNEEMYYTELGEFKRKLTPESFVKKEQVLRNKQIKKLIFEEYLTICDNMKNRQHCVSSQIVAAMESILYGAL